MDRIKLEGMEFFSSHGCEEEEKKYRQKIIVDLALYFDTSVAGKSDELSDTVNYAAVFDTVKDICEGEKTSLIEAVAERIAEAVLERYAPVKRARVTVHKPDAPLSGKYADVNVAISRERK